MQHVRALRLDCDGDALLALVEPAGPACHTGERTCFHNGDTSRPRRTRRCRRSSARSPTAQRERPERLLHRRAARRPAADRREGRGGGRGGRPRRARGDRRPRRRGGRRRPLPPGGAAAQPRPLARRRRGGAQWPSPLSRVVARASSPRSTRSARSRASTTWSRCATRFIDDCETPVTAFLKLRGPTRSPRPSCSSPPSRASASGATRSSACARARSCAGRSATRATRTRSPPTRSARYRQAPLPDAAAVHRRRGRLLRLRPRAHRRAARRAEPRRARPARHGADALRRARRLRPPQAHGHDPRQRLRRGRRELEAAYADARRDDRRRRARLLAGPRARGCGAPPRAARRSSRSNMPREQFEAMVARIVEYVHAGDAFQVVPSQRWSARARRRPVLDLPRPARRQPEPVHVLPGLRRLPGRGASPEPLLTVTGRRASTRPIAGTRPRGGDAAEDERDRRGAARRREGARRARDARRPRAQRPRPRVRVRQRSTVDTFMAVETYSHVMHIVSPSPGELRADVGAMDALRSVLPAGTLAARRRSARCRSSTSSSRSSAAATAARSATWATPATSTRASTSARSWSRTASPTSRPAAAPSPTPSPTTSSPSPRPRPAAVAARDRAGACEQPDWP